MSKDKKYKKLKSKLKDYKWGMRDIENRLENIENKKYLTKRLYMKSMRIIVTISLVVLNTVIIYKVFFATQ